MDASQDLRTLAAHLAELDSAVSPETGQRLSTNRELLLQYPHPFPAVDCLFIRCGGDTHWSPLTHTTTVGCSAESDLVLASKYVSGSHCRIEGSEAGWLVRDLGSKNGVRVNGVRGKEFLLKDGDTVQLADVLLTFSRRVESE